MKPMKKQVIIILSILAVIGFVVGLIIGLNAKDKETSPKPETPNIETPEVPFNPDEPETPTEPSVPADPVTPVAPPFPNQPDAPTNPAEPVVPENPPATPGTEVTPPDAPAEPDAPVNPSVPDVPPTEPINPTQPAEPPTPSTPPQPDVPPTVPEEPVVPEEPAHIHSYDSGVITKKATCGAKGVNTFTCSCGDTKTEDIPKLTTHNYSKVTINRDATCKNEGLKTYTCADCGNKKTETIPVLADHVWGKGEPGFYRIHYTCQVCRETKTVITCTHNWSEWEVAVPGSCVAGYEVRDCSICREAEKRPLPAVGHCVYEVVGHSPYARIWMCVGCYDIKEEALPEGNPDYKQPTGSTPSNIPRW